MNEKQTIETRKFITEIISVCIKYDRSISHEDNQGAFIIEDYNDSNIEWFSDAFDKTTDKEEVTRDDT
jgi:hypothetical protein